MERRLIDQSHNSPPNRFRQRGITLAEIRARLKDKFGSLRSTKHWFALRSLAHYALNNHERATSERHFLLDAGFRARTPTLMHGGWFRRKLVDCFTTFTVWSVTPGFTSADTGTPSLVCERHARRAFRYPRSRITALAI
jgi:hypothetical protein